jgi:hypothetical protein
MASITVPYEREFTDANINAIARRATDTISVLEQLGADYANLPGMALAAYQSEAQAFNDKFDQFRDVVAQLQPLLSALDDLAQPLDAKNKAALQLLRGALQGTENEVLLDQITGPTQQGGTSSPTPPTPPNP